MGHYDYDSDAGWDSQTKAAASVCVIVYIESTGDLVCRGDVYNGHTNGGESNHRTVSISVVLSLFRRNSTHVFCALLTLFFYFLDYGRIELE